LGSGRSDGRQGVETRLRGARWLRRGNRKQDSYLQTQTPNKYGKEKFNNEYVIVKVRVKVANSKPKPIVSPSRLKPLVELRSERETGTKLVKVVRVCSP
jgi:hypothetical protein